MLDRRLNTLRRSDHWQEQRNLFPKDVVFLHASSNLQQKGQTFPSNLQAIGSAIGNWPIRISSKAPPVFRTATFQEKRTHRPANSRLPGSVWSKAAPVRASYQVTRTSARTWTWSAPARPTNAGRRRPSISSGSKRTRGAANEKNSRVVTPGMVDAQGPVTIVYCLLWLLHR
jgi:hypothetical protein